MAYVITDVLAGSVDLYQVDTLGPGPLAGLATGPTSRGFTNYPGMELRGWDANLGAGSFIYGRASATIAAGGVCEVGINVTNGRYDTTMTAWAGTAISGKPLATALVALTVGQYGWFQVEGVAVTNVTGAPAVGNAAYWQAAGVVSPTVVASKHMLNSVFVSAVSAVIGSGTASTATYAPGSTAGTLPSTQALVFMNRPLAQGAIT